MCVCVLLKYLRFTFSSVSHLCRWIPGGASAFPEWSRAHGSWGWLQPHQCHRIWTRWLPDITEQRYSRTDCFSCSISILLINWPSLLALLPSWEQCFHVCRLSLRSVGLLASAQSVLEHLLVCDPPKSSLSSRHEGEAQNELCWI